MFKMTPKVSLVVVPMLIHVFAGTVTIAYNFLCREILHTTTANDARIKLAAIGYFFVASALSAFLNRRLIDAADTPERITLIPIWRAFTNSLTWLGAIPALGAIAYIINGRINVTNFTNFSASIIIGWLIATSYSTLYYILKISHQADNTWASTVKKLDATLKILPWLATIVPLIAATSLPVFIRPEILMTRSGVLFNGFLVLLYTLGAYGAIYVAGKAKKIRVTLNSAPVAATIPPEKGIPCTELVPLS
jgi:hypothetical protein